MSDLRERFRAESELFDEQELPKGHKERFEAKLTAYANGGRKNYLRTLKVAATLLAVASLAAFWLLSSPASDPKKETAATPSHGTNDIPLKDAAFYYEQSVDEQLATISQYYGDKDSKQLIDQSKTMLSELREQFRDLEEELENTGDERIVIAMINNYKSRIELLEELINQLKNIKHLKQENHASPQNV